MINEITKIFDAADSIGAKITQIESNGLFSTIQYEKDYINCFRQIDHRMTFSKIVDSLQNQFDQTKLIIQNKVK